MWLKVVNAKADPARVEDLRKLYNGQVSDFFNTQKGHRFHYLLESPTDPSDIIFLSGWDSEEEMTAAYASDAHKEAGGNVRQYLTAPSERKIYEVHE